MFAKSSQLYSDGSERFGRSGFVSGLAIYAPRSIYELLSGAQKIVGGASSATSNVTVSTSEVSSGPQLERDTIMDTRIVRQVDANDGS